MRTTKTTYDRDLCELSRSNLLAFIKFTKPDYQIGWVHREICARLMKFFVDVKHKRSPRLILTMPPRHGKSEAVSRRFPSWCFGVDPDINIIAASYTGKLAWRMSKDVQKIMDSYYYSRVFPDTFLSKSPYANSRVKKIRQTELFEIVNGEGSYRAAGVGGGITGMGCDILNIDDPLKDRKSAESPTVRDAIYDWYTSTAYTRLAPGGGVLLTLTRWHEDDLAGRLLEKMAEDDGDTWEIINYPAIAEEDEKYRKKGDALHPERYDLDALSRIKKAIGSYEWEALYQQHPSSKKGGIFKKDWLKRYYTIPRVFDFLIQSWDFTFDDTDSSDNVAGTVWGVIGSNIYLLDCVCKQMDFVTQVQEMKRMTNKWPNATGKIVEAKANGPAIINSLSNEIPGLIPFMPQGSKKARAFAVSPTFEAGNIWVPDKSIAPWVEDYVQELTRFPAAKHDDRVDSTTQAIITINERICRNVLWEVNNGKTE